MTAVHTVGPALPSDPAGPRPALAAWRAAALCALTAALAGAQDAEGARPVRGAVAASTDWEGKLLLEGDVEVAAGATLRIRRGTQVFVAAADSLRSGWNRALVEIHVHGRLLIEGGPNAPVRFLPVARLREDGAPTQPKTHGPGADPPDWHGIVLHDGDDDVLEHFVVLGAHEGVAIPHGDPRITGAIAVGCSTGISVGAAYLDERQRTAAGRSSPVIAQSRFTNCHTGVFGEDQAAAEVDRCVFDGCRYGIGNARRGYTFVMVPPGWLVRRCAFLHNRFAFSGFGVCENSIFWKNDTAYQVSAFHGRLAARIEPVSLSSNSYGDNRVDFAGETGLDSTGVRGAPGFVGDADRLDPWGPALPDALQLRPDALARGAANDGGDLGPTGAALGAAAGNLASWSPAGDEVRHVLVMRTSGKDRERAGKTPTAPALGGRVQGEWWVVAATEPRAGLDVLGTYGVANRTGWLGVPVEVTRPERVRVELNGDLDAYEIRFDDAAVATGAQRRRFGRSGVVAEVDVPTAGEHVVVVWFASWGETPRIALSLSGATNAVDAIAHTEPAPVDVNIASLRGRRDDRQVQVYCDGELSWLGLARHGAVRFTTGAGEEIDGSGSAVLEMDGPEKILIRNVPEGVTNGCRVRIEGLRSPSGAELPVLEAVIGRRR